MAFARGKQRKIFCKSLTVSPRRFFARSRCGLGYGETRIWGSRTDLYHRAPGFVASRTSGVSPVGIEFPCQETGETPVLLEPVECPDSQILTLGGIEKGSILWWRPVFDY
jgi:hypothetical protein